MEASLSTLRETTKQYEVLAELRNPLHSDILEATEIVKEFIREHKLILYGGTAIDMALRLAGSQLYPDDAIADLDFYSHNSVEHSYLLADRLYKHGWSEARSIVALFLTVMKNDIGDNNFVTDIKYLPRRVFDVVPTLNYDGMLCVHPLWQFIDVHSALSFPYGDPPTEVIFNRWSKDITRFNMLLEKYPGVAPPTTRDQVNSGVTPPTTRDQTNSGVTPPTTRDQTNSGVAPGDSSRDKVSVTTIPSRLRELLWDGCAAYAFIYRAYVELAAQLHVDVDPTIIPATIEFTQGCGTDTHPQECVRVELIDGTLECIHYDLEKCVSDYAITDTTYYDPVGEAFPERVEGKFRELLVRVSSVHNKLVTMNFVKLNHITYRIANIQAVMKYFLSYYFVCMSGGNPLASAYLVRYTSLLKMCAIGDVAVGTDVESEWKSSPLALSIETYGRDNINKQTEYILSGVYEKIDNAPPMTKPASYIPSRNKPHPTFDYASAPAFRVGGEPRT